MYRRKFLLKSMIIFIVKVDNSTTNNNKCPEFEIFMKNINPSFHIYIFIYTDKKRKRGRKLKARYHTRKMSDKKLEKYRVPVLVCFPEEKVITEIIKHLNKQKSSCKS